MGFAIKRRVCAVAVSVLAAAATTASLSIAGLAVSAGPAAADTTSDFDCPSTIPPSTQVDNQVSASYSVSGTTATYTFDSNVNLHPSGGIPGLIEYCVFTSPLPDSSAVTPGLAGADGSLWTNSGDNSKYFGFSRPTGNPTNIPLDGTTGITMGTASWAGGVPSTQTILLHINDASECGALGSSGSTCYVYPGTPQTGNQDLTVSKTAAPSFTRTYTWGISKDVDHTTLDIAKGGSATFNYTVSVTHDAGTDSAWKVTGHITVANPNTTAFTGVNVSDAIDNGGNCSISNGSPGSVDPTNATIPGSGSVDFPYTCTYSAAPSPSSFTNTATAAWSQATYNTPDGSATGKATGDFANVTPAITDGSVDVTDTLGGHLGTVSYTDPSPTKFTYPYTFSGDPAGTCTTHDNTATFTTSDTGSTDSAGQSVKVCVGADLGVSKTAAPSFTRTYLWSINKTATPTLIEQAGGGTASASYAVTVKQTGYSDSNWKVTGDITVTNPNDWEPVTAAVSDAIDNGGNCSISNGSPGNVDPTSAVIPASGSVDFPYTCTYASAPNPSAFTNTATAGWNKDTASTPDNSATGTAQGDFSKATPATVNKTISPVDTFGGTTAALCTLTTTVTPCSLTATDSAPFTSQTYNYSRSLTVPANNCVTYPNTAMILETGQKSGASVEVCGPAKTGALTMGFWQNKNGQGIITGGSATSGVCNSGTWLRQYAPFQDLSATASCSAVATYVTNIIKAANASGPTMNAMLKAQMLATALDVYFSDASLGGNKIGAPGPVGSVTVDLTKVCVMNDSSGTCAGSENVSSAFGGASSLTISQMLSYAASKSNVGGSTWYGNVKATQGLAKDAFDAINNQQVFSP